GGGWGWVGGGVGEGVVRGAGWGAGGGGAPPLPVLSRVRGQCGSAASIASARSRGDMAVSAGAVVSWRTTKATLATITAAPTRMLVVTCSPRIAQPSSTATTGLTKAYVATVEMRTFCSSQT